MFVVAAVGPACDLGAVAGLVLLSNVAVGPGPSYGSSEAGLLNIFIISCDMPISLFGGVADLVDGCAPAGALADEELVADLADVCGPVCGLDDDGVVGVVAVGFN